MIGIQSLILACAPAPSGQRLRHTSGIVQLTLHRFSAFLSADFGAIVLDDHLRLDALHSLEKFRVGLHELEAQGCLPSGDADQVLQRLEASIPMPPAIAVFLRYGLYPVDGAMDLIPGMRLKEVTPIRDARGRTLGYETAWFDVVPRRSGGVALRLTGKPTDAPHNARDHGLQPQPVDLNFPVQARFLRQLLLQSISSADHPILLLAGADQNAMDYATSVLQRQPSRCATLSGQAWCHAVPYESALTAEIRIRVHRKTVYVPVDDTVADAIETAATLSRIGCCPICRCGGPFTATASRSSGIARKRGCSGCKSWVATKFAGKDRSCGKMRRVWPLRISLPNAYHPMRLRNCVMWAT